MKTEPLVTIITRLMAVYIFVQYFLLQVAFIPFANGGVLAGFRWIAAMIFVLALAGAMWFFSAELAQKVVPANMRDKELATQITYEQLQVLLCFLLGLSFIVQHLAALFSFFAHMSGGGIGGFGRQAFAAFVPIVAGLVIMLRGPGLLGLVSKLRNTRYHSPIDPEA